MILPMQKLHFSKLINAPQQRVWETMLAKDTYVKWTDVFSPNPGDESYFEGDWSEGSKMRFIGVDTDGKKGGMVSRIEKNDPYNFLSIKHLGILEGDQEITSGEQEEGWVGAHENYTFLEKDGGTELQIDVDSNDDFVEFFNESWPQGLEKLKKLVEES